MNIQFENFTFIITNKLIYQNSNIVISNEFLISSATLENPVDPNDFYYEQQAKSML